jgi:ERF superfamily
MTGPVAPMPPEIAKAIVGVMSEVKKLGKEGKNTFQKYNFTSVDQFYEALGPLMAAHGIFDVAIERESTVAIREASDDRGVAKASAWLTSSYDFMIFHESGVSYGPISRTIQVPATGAQSYAAAQSYAEKYFLRGLFKIPTGDVDEVDAGDQRGLPAKPTQPPPPPAPRAVPTRRPGLVSDAQAERIVKLIAETGNTIEAVTQHYKVDRISDITEAHANALEAKLAMKAIPPDALTDFDKFQAALETAKSREGLDAIFSALTKNMKEPDDRGEASRRYHEVAAKFVDATK